MKVTDLAVMRALKELFNVDDAVSVYHKVLEVHQKYRLALDRLEVSQDLVKGYEKQIVELLPLSPEEQHYIDMGKKILATRMYRERTGLSLSTCWQTVKAYLDSPRNFPLVPKK